MPYTITWMHAYSDMLIKYVYTVNEYQFDGIYVAQHLLTQHWQ